MHSVMHIQMPERRGASGWNRFLEMFQFVETTPTLNLLLLCNLCSFYDIKVFRELFLFRSGIGSLDYVLIQCSLFYFISYLVLSNKVQGHRPSSLRALWQRRSRSNKTIRHAIVVQHSACWSDLQSLCCPISSWKNRRQRDDGNVSSPPRGLQYGQCLATDPPSFK